jgi:hypothetical protein
MQTAQLPKEMSSIPTSHPRPYRARIEWTAALLVVTCLALLAIGVGASARASQPTATISSTALHNAIAARTTADRALSHDSAVLSRCLRTRPGHCGAQRLAVRRSRGTLSAARRRVLNLTARIARRRTTTSRKGTHTPAGATSGSGFSSVDGSTSGGSGSSTSGTGSSKGSGSTSGTGDSTGSGKSSGSTGSGTTSGTGGSTGNGSSTDSTGSGTETTTPPVEAPPAPSTPSFQPGLNSGWEPTWDVEGAAKLGAKLIRLDVGIEQSPQSMEPIVADYAAKGIEVEFLADFYGSMPTSAEADNLATWAKTFGPGGSFWAKRSDGQLAATMIEFGNETSYSYQYSNDTTTGYASRAQTYALRFKEAAIAIHAVNPAVGLLAQGDAGNAGATWIENMFKAVPNLGQYVAGWTIHPYGPGWRPRVEALIHETAAQGAPSSIPIDITEWGLATDNGKCLTENYGWNPCMTYNEASEVLTRTVSEMRQVLGSRMGLFMLYQVRDKQSTGASNNREEYFGALQHELQPKGAYTTAAQALMAS